MIRCCDDMLFISWLDRVLQSSAAAQVPGRSVSCAAQSRGRSVLAQRFCPACSPSVRARLQSAHVVYWRGQVAVAQACPLAATSSMMILCSIVGLIVTCNRPKQRSSLAAAFVCPAQSFAQLSPRGQVDVAHACTLLVAKRGSQRAFSLIKWSAGGDVGRFLMRVQ